MDGDIGNSQSKLIESLLTKLQVINKLMAWFFNYTYNFLLHYLRNKTTKAIKFSINIIFSILNLT